MTSIERQSQLLKRGEAIRKLPIQPTDPFEAGEMVERERIIKLLEQVAVDEDGCFAERLPETLIALIRGDNK
jgi:hypothetical protein